MRSTCILLLGLSITACVLGPKYCKSLPHPRVGQRTFTTVRPGTYMIHLEATGGDHSGAIASGQLSLRVIDPAVRPGPGRLYGWTNVDLLSVGAPICSEEKTVASSTDPLNPGVVVSRGRNGDDVLTVANCHNKYTPGWACVDGCGVDLYVDRADNLGFEGRWSAAGILLNGCGYFEATKEPE